MATAKKLPERDVLAEHHEAGMSNREIGELYGASAEAVRLALIKHGIQQERLRPDHKNFVPWRLRADHAGDVIHRRLRSYSKLQQGKALTATERRLLEQFMRYMDGENPWRVPLSVHYNRMDETGFWLEPRQPGDRDYISPPLAS